MAASKDDAVTTTTTPSETSVPSDIPSSQDTKNARITLAQRGVVDHDNATAQTEDETARRNRTLLSAQEEKALLRRIDWRIMTICSLLFLLKNIDADNISNARIMNKGTDRNIMTELNMTSDQYNLLNVLYYVCMATATVAKRYTLTIRLGALHRIRGTVELTSQEVQAQCMAIQDHEFLGHCAPRARRSTEQGRDICNQISSWTGTVAVFTLCKLYYANRHVHSSKPACSQQ